MKGYSYLLWAYNIVWIALAAYIGMLFVRLRKVSDRLERLERKVGED